MKKQKVLLILAPIIIILLILVIWFIGKGSKANTQETLDISKMPPEKAAEELVPYLPEMDKQQITEYLDIDLFFHSLYLGVGLFLLRQMR